MGIGLNAKVCHDCINSNCSGSDDQLKWTEDDTRFWVDKKIVYCPENLLPEGTTIAAHTEEEAPEWCPNKLSHN